MDVRVEAVGALLDRDVESPVGAGVVGLAGSELAEAEALAQETPIDDLEPLREVLNRIDPGALRLLMCQTHYRAPFEWSETQERQAKETFESLRRQLDPAEAAEGKDDAAPGELEVEAKTRLEAFDAAMDDDFSTPRALAELFSLAAAVARCRLTAAGAARVAGVRDGILARLGALGIPMDFARAELPADLKPLLDERAAARKGKDFKRADEIRELFKARGWGIEDTPRGQVPRKL